MGTHRRIQLARILSVMFAALALSACGPGSDDAAPSDEPPPVKDTAFGDMVGTMDKARGVQDDVDAHKKELDQKLRASEGE